MNMLKLTAAAALVAASLSASAMTSIADQDLSAISGQDGVSIAADLNINIGAFTYKDTDATGGSVSFNNITVRGMMAMTIDVLNATAFQAGVGGSIAQADADLHGASTLSAAQVAGVGTAVGTSLGYTGGDVVQFAFPASGDADTHSVTPTITVGSITTGNGGKSFGSIAIQNLDLQGTKVWMFGH
ncbi:MAG TPA: DUF6160 family protein [Burkholderiaceae bacterium]